MKKINFINIKKLTPNEYEKIKDLPINLVYRYSLKLVRTYPSIKRDAIRESMILDYQDGRKFTDQKQIEGGIYQAKGFLHHLITYQMVMEEMRRSDKNDFYHRVDPGFNHMQVTGTNLGGKRKNKDKNFEYFE
jgi:hypothetical protein